jgi:hypothetical protein
MEEYKLCSHEYSYRDKLSVTIFSIIISLISFLMIKIMLGEINYPNDLYHHITYFIGLLILMVLILDLEKTVSCKIAVRERSREIEKEFLDDNDFFPKIQEKLDNRNNKLGFDNWLPKLSVATMMRFTAYIFILLWTIAFYGKSLIPFLNGVAK